MGDREARVVLLVGVAFGFAIGTTLAVLVFLVASAI
jgi:hypothetical protein